MSPIARWWGQITGRTDYQLLVKEIRRMSAQLDTLTNDVGALTTVVGLAADRIKTLDDPAKLTALSTAVQTATKTLSDALAPPVVAAP